MERLQTVVHVMVNNHIPEGIFRSLHPSVYSGWWYCCIPTANIRARGLPLPLFIRCDDMEYSWRHHGIHHITLNGICIWHQAFNEGRSLAAVGRSERYFAPRNMFVRNALHIPGVEAEFPRYFWAWFKDGLVQYNYQWAELLLAAMEDLLRGPDCLKDDPDKILERLRHVFQPPSYQVGEQEWANFRHAHPAMSWKRRLLYKLTLGGLLLPPALFPKAEGKCLGPFCPPGQFATPPPHARARRIYRPVQRLGVRSPQEPEAGPKVPCFALEDKTQLPPPVPGVPRGRHRVDRSGILATVPRPASCPARRVGAVRGGGRVTDGPIPRSSREAESPQIRSRCLV